MTPTCFSAHTPRGNQRDSRPSKQTEPTGLFPDDMSELTEVVEHDPTPLILEAGGRSFVLLGGRVILRSLHQ